MNSKVLCKGVLMHHIINSREERWQSCNFYDGVGLDVAELCCLFCRNSDLPKLDSIYCCKYVEVIAYIKPFWRCTENIEILCIFDLGKFFNNFGSADAFSGCKNYWNKCSFPKMIYLLFCRMCNEWNDRMINYSVEVVVA
jgi:hypothetical protein